ncbi:hypothetical protein ACFY5D_03500 [Paeniglutamicibacter sp. NPDC012692]|uniref:hypothetical protein n=1 Tax=Paeniglutamicibacter sp. NPDC012692 TaxID=3364388 RepID=UPI0036CC06FF
MSEHKDAWAKLRAPFNPGQISQLPKPYKANSERGNCNVCGGWHGLPAMHLDYVGHAALTDRLLEVDPEWSWEPLAIGPDGLPVFDSFGGLWIRLTICGVTRLGYGDAAGKNNANGVKEAIGDALRNAGMRFGAALDLWHKGDLWAAKEEQGIVGDDAPAAPPVRAQQAPTQQLAPNVDWPKEILKARNSEPALLQLLAKAQGLGAPQQVIDQINVEGRALSERKVA